MSFDKLHSNPASATAYASIAPSVGTLITVPGYADGVIHAGTTFGQPASGIRADGDVNFPQLDAFVLVDNADALRYAPQGGTDGASLGAAVLTQNEVTALLKSALTVANHARAQIRQPLNSAARVTVSVVDTQGAVLGIVRSRDAPVFGIDVSLQKARTAAFYSSATAATFLSALPPARYISTGGSAASVAQSINLGDYVSAVRTFLGNNTALGDGAIAFTDRAGGNLSRPFFPDGIEGNPPGPFSKPVGQWSVFSTGLQLDISINAILQHVLYVSGAIPTDVAKGCAGVSISNDLSTITQTVSGVRAGNGFQIFPGSVPIYRGNTLVGALGVSGDGVDQDDMIAFLGVDNAGMGLNNAPKAMRADTLTPQGIRLRYVQCPQSPFLDSDAQNVCEGK
ncbi:MAG: heme-binding protein [Steroidobacter sp.]